MPPQHPHAHARTHVSEATDRAPQPYFQSTRPMAMIAPSLAPPPAAYLPAAPEVASRSVLFACVVLGVPMILATLTVAALAFA